MTQEIRKATAADAGCWIDGHWGQYGVARQIGIAEVLGFADSELIVLADRHMASMGPSDAEGLTSDEYWAMVDGESDVTEWLNANVAPEGFSFGWNDGEFFLWSDEEWAETDW